MIGTAMQVQYTRRATHISSLIPRCEVRTCKDLCRELRQEASVDEVVLLDENLTQARLPARVVLQVEAVKSVRTRVEDGLLQQLLRRQYALHSRVYSAHRRWTMARTQTNNSSRHQVHTESHLIPAIC